MSTFEDDDTDFAEDETELDLSGFDSDDDEPLSLDDDFTEED